VPPPQSTVGPDGPGRKKGGQSTAGGIRPILRSKFQPPTTWRPDKETKKEKGLMRKMGRQKNEGEKRMGGRNSGKGAVFYKKSVGKNGNCGRKGKNALLVTIVRGGKEK